VIKNKFKWGIVIFIAIFLVGLFRLSSIYLDNEAEERVEKMYPRDKNGVIEGLQSISIKQGKDKAILLIHGFADSPAVFADLIIDIKNKSNSDIYAPLLPFDGRNLQTLTKSNNQILLSSINQTIQNLSEKYQSLTVVGMSYGGALLAKLAYEKKIPENVKLVFYSPGFYIKSNNYIGRTIAEVYSYWRKYCDYSILGCGSPSYASADAVAKPQFKKQKPFKYVDVPALLTMYKFDLQNRLDLGAIHRPYSIIIAKDDNRISYEKIKSACYDNKKYCRLYSFPSGRHMIHWGANKEKFEDLILKLNSD
jgi:esterase/lipase